MTSLHIDMEYLKQTLFQLLAIPSPSGYTDRIVRHTCGELGKLGVNYEITRRGAVRATIKGKQTSPDRAVIAHLDTLGGMVKGRKENGRCRIVPIGHWSSRFAEGARVTIFSEQGNFRGTILPCKASGHTYNEEIDTQPNSWDNVEIRVDAKCANAKDLEELGIHVGDFVAVDPNTEFADGFINSRHLDDKAGVACLLTAIKAVLESGRPLPVDCHPLFTIFEEVGAGASAVLHGDCAEMIAIDNATPAPGQNSSEFGVTIAMMDSSGPFDYHLNRKLIGLCRENQITFSRDVFRYYRCDAAAAVEAGNDIRTALIGFGADGSHGWERVHQDSLQAVTSLIAHYLLSPPTNKRDKTDLGPLSGFTNQPEQDQTPPTIFWKPKQEH